jgi:hypothetical protein
MPNHTDKKSAKQLRDELRELRKDAVKPVSKMRMSDISVEIERLKKMRETTPAAAAVPSVPTKQMKPTVSSLKEAKELEFPVAPDAGVKKSGAAPKAKAKKEAAVAAPEEKKKMSMKDKMAKMLAMMDEGDE